MQLFIPPKHLIVQEFIDPETFAKKNIDPWWYIDPEIVWTAYQIRLRFNKPMTINTWKWGGIFKHRGFRPKSAKEWSQYSQHSRGHAIDFDIAGMTASEVRADILKNPNIEAYKYITCIELNVNWVHIDNRPWDKAGKGILKVTP